MKKLILPFWILILASVALLLIINFFPANRNSGSDKSKLTIIGNSGYYTDGSKIFYSFTGDKILLDVDKNTFKTISHDIAKDAKYVYVENRIQTGIDPESFIEYIPKFIVRTYVDFFVDKNDTYYLSKESGELAIKPSPLDPRKMEFVGDYIKTENGIYQTGYDSITKLEGVDPETFKVLGQCYSVEMSRASYMADKNHVYVGDKILEGANPETFKQIAVIKSNPGDEIPYSMTIWKDSSHIYAHCGKIITEADYSTFEYLGDNKAQDKNNLYSLHTGGGYDVTPRK